MRCRAVLWRMLAAIAANTNRRRLVAATSLAIAGIAGSVWRDGEPVSAKKKRRKKRRNTKKRNRRRAAPGIRSAGNNEEHYMVTLINAYRASNGLQPLALQDQLDQAARHHSVDMAQKNYFSHRLWSGLTPEQNIERFGYTGWRAVGENIAAGYGMAGAVLAGWKDSPEHDQNLRNPNFTEIGVARAYNSNSRYGWYWTATFGRR